MNFIICTKYYNNVKGNEFSLVARPANVTHLDMDRFPLTTKTIEFLCDFTVWDDYLPTLDQVAKYTVREDTVTFPAESLLLLWKYFSNSFPNFIL